MNTVSKNLYSPFLIVRKRSSIHFILLLFTTLFLLLNSPLASAIVVDPSGLSCLAYKLTATNRAPSIDIKAVTISDTLQKKGVSSAQVTSVLTIPACISSPASIGYSDTVAYG